MILISWYKDLLDFLINKLMPFSDRIDISILYAIGIVIILALIPKMDLIADKISKFFMIISAFALFILTLLVSYDVITRKLFSGGSIALQELEWHLFDIIFLFGLAYTLSKNKHVRVDIFYDKFPFRLQKFINLIALIAFVVPLSTLIILESLSFIQMSIAQNEGSGDPGGLPDRWIIKSAMFWAFIIMLIQSAGEIRKNIYMIIKGKK